jgi:hypothetical protein
MPRRSYDRACVSGFLACLEGSAAFAEPRLGSLQLPGRDRRPSPSIGEFVAAQRFVDRADLLPPAEISLDALWQEPHEFSAQDLYNGPWGAANAPDPNAIYEFVRSKSRATSPGLVVQDPRGRVWHVKQGREAAAEVVASRVLSALGYHQPPVYFRRPSSSELGKARAGSPRDDSD